jgi:hypothetical protein
MGSAINRGLTFRMAQTPVQHCLPLLQARRERPSRSVLRHHAACHARTGSRVYKTFRDKKDDCIKVVLKREKRPTDSRSDQHARGTDVVGVLAKRMSHGARLQDTWPCDSWTNR